MWRARTNRSFRRRSGRCAWVQAAKQWPWFLLPTSTDPDLWMLGGRVGREATETKEEGGGKWVFDRDWGGRVLKCAVSCNWGGRLSMLRGTEMAVRTRVRAALSLYQSLFFSRLLPSADIQIYSAQANLHYEIRIRYMFAYMCSPDVYITDAYNTFNQYLSTN